MKRLFALPFVQSASLPLFSFSFCGSTSLPLLYPLLCVVCRCGLLACFLSCWFFFFAIDRLLVSIFRLSSQAFSLFVMHTGVTAGGSRGKGRRAKAGIMRSTARFSSSFNVSLLQLPLPYPSPPRRSSPRSFTVSPSIMMGAALVVVAACLFFSLFLFSLIVVRFVLSLFGPCLSATAVLVLSLPPSLPPSPRPPILVKICFTHKISLKESPPLRAFPLSLPPLTPYIALIFFVIVNTALFSSPNLGLPPLKNLRTKKSQNKYK